MKVLALGVDPKLFVEGSAVRARQVEYGLLVEELHIVSYTKPGFEKVKLSENVWVYPTNSKNKLAYFWDCWKIVREILKREGRFIITSQEGITHMLALVLSYRYRLGFEMQIHTDIFSPRFRQESLANKLRLFGYWLAKSRASSIRVVSKRIAKGLIEKWGVPGRKISVLPALVNKSYWQNAPIKKDLRAQYPQFDQIILMASRLSREKNIPLALEAFSIVHRRLPTAGLVIVGDGEFANKIRGEGVILVPWTNELASYYKSADLFLMTSNYEGLGLTLLEAAICGTPIVTTNVGVVGDLINPYNALIASVGDKDKLAAHMIFLLQNKEARTMMRGRLSKISQSLPEKDVYLKLFKQSWDKCLTI